MPDRMTWSELESIADQEPQEFSGRRRARGSAHPLELYTAAALLEEPATMSELRFLPFLGQDGVIAEGWTHLVSSGVRVGKTELVARVAIGWLRLGRTMLWFTEESRQVWRQRVGDLRGIYGTSVPWHRLTFCYAVGASTELMVARVVAGQEQIVVADTLRHVTQVEDENDAGVVRAALTPWLEAMGPRTLVALTHNRKGRPQPGSGSADAVAGSHVLTSMFDVILQLRETGDERTRRLTGRSRLFEVAPLTISKDDDGRMFVTAGQHGLTSGGEMERRAYNALLAERVTMTTREVRAKLQGPPSIDAVYRALARLAQGGSVLRDPAIPAEAQGQTVNWSLPAGDRFRAGAEVPGAGAEVPAEVDLRAGAEVAASSGAEVPLARAHADVVPLRPVVAGERSEPPRGEALAGERCVNASHPMNGSVEVSTARTRAQERFASIAPPPADCLAELEELLP
jgi:hypothetical protein